MLAIHGGEPAFASTEMATQWPIWGPEEVEALQSVLASRVWSRTKDARWDEGESGQFEEEFRHYLGSRHLMAVANGTFAIELALLALGVGPQDEVLVPASTFFGSITPVLRLGAVPVFVDIDPNTFTIDPRCLADRVTPRSRAVIAVHLNGVPANLDGLLEVCRAHDLNLVEDCAQATGSSWRGQMIGTFGAVGCFSFQQDKALQAGEGGGVATQEARLAGRMYAYHQGFVVQGAPGQEKHEVSTNMRITPWQAAILRCQLRRIDEQIDRRARHAAALFAALGPEDALQPVQLPSAVTRWSIYTCPFRYQSANMAGVSRDQFLQALRAEGIPAWEGHTEPVYRRPLFRENRLVYRNAGCPEAERVSVEESLVIGQRFFLGPPSWVERLIHIIRRLQDSSPRLRKTA